MTISFGHSDNGTSQITNVETTNDEPPVVFFTSEVLEAIDYLVAQCNQEISYVGLVDELADGNYLVHKIYVPKQTVSAATAEIDHGAMSDLTNEILDADLDPSTLRFHGHSHVNMSISPSSADQKQIADWLEHTDYMIRAIQNKHGDCQVDVFDKRTMTVYHNVTTADWDRQQSPEFYQHLDALIKDNVQQRVYKTQFSKPRLGTKPDSHDQRHLLPPPWDDIDVMRKTPIDTDDDLFLGHWSNP